MAYRPLRAIVGLLFRIFTRFEVVGLENLPPKGALILVTNHIHLLDPPATLVALPRPVTPLAAQKWRGTVVGLLLRLVGAIFIKRGEVDRRALRRSLAVLRQGGILGLAPEGTRSKTHDLQPARAGVAYIAHLSGAPLLPVAVTGVEEAIPALLHLRRARVRVTIGEPFVLPVLDHKPKASELLEQADLVMHRIAALLPPAYRGVYAGGGKISKRSPAPQG